MATDEYRSARTLTVEAGGLSLGGFIAPLIARSRPALVRRMVLAGTSAAGGHGLVDIVGVFQDALARAGQRGRHPKHLLFFTPTARSQAAADAFLARLETRREDRDAATTMEGHGGVFQYHEEFLEQAVRFLDG